MLFGTLLHLTGNPYTNHYQIYATRAPQGWRLDPLLLLCQALTTSVALWYGLEAFKLRGKEVEELSRRSPDQLPGGAWRCIRGVSICA